MSDFFDDDGIQDSTVDLEAKPDNATEPEDASFFGFGSLWQRCVPVAQRRKLPELTDDVDLDSGDGPSKRSGFWAMLTLSGIIATCGVAADSTATVIGAMIIAPLATPVLGLGLGLVTGRRVLVWHSLGYVAAGLLLITLMGAVAGWAMTDTSRLLENSQISGRTSPGLLDLISALATGLVAAIVRSRRDLNDALPGVAIAISLVPPISVVGICLAAGSWAFAAGAFLLFASNVVAMMIAATIVFFWVGYPRERYLIDPVDRPKPIRHVMAIAFVAVALPMVANTALTGLRAIWTGQITDAAATWLDDTSGASIDDVSWQGDRVIVAVRSPGDLPDVSTLESQIDEILPVKQTLEVVHTQGERTVHETDEREPRADR